MLKSPKSARLSPTSLTVSTLALGAILGAAPAYAAPELILSTPTAIETQGTFQGKRAVWRNVGSVGGVTIDLVATLISTTLDHQFDTVAGAPAVVSAGLDPHEVRWQIFQAGTFDLNTPGSGTPVTADVHVQINDVDGPNNEQVFLPVCDGTVDYLRIDSNATTNRLFDNASGVFTLAGDKGYNNEAVSGLEINYTDTNTFEFGRTAKTNFLIRVANPTYLEADTLDLQCGDFRPIQLDPDQKVFDRAPSAAVEFDPLLNDSVAELNTSGLPSEYALQALSLRSPAQMDPASTATVSGIVTDGKGDVTGFTVTSQGQVEGSWSYDDATGKLTFTPQAGFARQPSQIGYRIRRAATSGDTYSAATTVTIISPAMGGKLDANFSDENGDGRLQPGETIAVSWELRNIGGLAVTGLDLAWETFNGAGAAPLMTLDSVTPDADPGTFVPGERLVYTGTYTVSEADAGRDLSLRFRASGLRNGEAVSDLSDSVIANAGVGTRSEFGPGAPGDDPHPLSLPALPVVTAANDSATRGGRTGAADIVDLLANDDLSGVAATPANTTLTRDDPATGPLTLSSDGSVDLAAATPAGTYTLDYTICEAANLSNCDSARLSVTVTAAPLLAATDRAGPHVGRRTGAIGGAPLALSNDTIEGDPAQLSEVSVTAGSINGISLGADGQIGLDAPKAAGLYTRPYQICEDLNPGNCVMGQIEVDVTAAPITAQADDAGRVPGRSGIAGTGAVLSNDLLDGAQLAAQEVALSVSAADPQGRLTMDGDGRLSLAPASPAGIYALDYEICENLNPGNCAIATASIEALAATLSPAADLITAVNRPAGHDALGNVLSNDLIDGAAIGAGDVTLAVTLPAASPLSVAPDGTVSSAGGAPNGRHEGSYEICEVLNPANCTGPVAFAVELTDRTLRVVEIEEGRRAIDSFTPDPAVSYTLYDADAGLFELDAQGALSFVTAPDFEQPADADGDNVYAVTVTATDAAGAQTDQGLLIRVVDLDEIAPVPSGPSGQTGPAAAISIGENKTVIASYGADEAVSWSLSGVDAARFAIDTDGNLTFVTPPDFEQPADVDGDNVYELVVTATDARGNATPQTLRVTIIDTGEIVAADDTTPTPVAGQAGTKNAIDILANDLANGARPTSADVTLRLLPGGELADGRITLTAGGALSVAAGTPAGRYRIAYDICRKDAPSICAQADAVIDVAAALLTLAPDDFLAAPIPGREGGLAGNLLQNDLFDGIAVPADKVTATLLSSTAPGLRIDANGALLIAPDTPEGDYTATYRVCERLNPSNCARSTATFGVGQSVIEISDDDLTEQPIYGVSGGKTVPVTANDQLGGAAVVPGEAILSILDDGGLDGVGIDAEGRITVPTFTEPGLYDVGYGLCEALNPANCLAGTATLSVVPIAAVAGTIFDDTDRDGRYDPTVDRGVGAGYRVMVIDAQGRTQPIFDAAGAPVEFVTTRADGTYDLYVDAGAGYRVVMYTPSGDALGGFGIGDLKPGERLEDQNLPIDPSGVIYDSITRRPIAGVRVTLTDAAGAALPARCLADPAQQNQLTGADGYYRFDVAPAAAPQCPAVQTEYRIAMDLPSGFVAGTSARLPLTSSAPYDATTCEGDPVPGGNCEISASANPPRIGETARYFLSFLLEPGDPNVINNHIAVDPILAEPVLSITALRETVRRGVPVPFRITASDVEYERVDITDYLPEGFVFAPGSATVNGAAAEPAVSGRSVTFAGLRAGADRKIEIEIEIVAAGEIALGSHVSLATLRDPDDGRVLARAQAAITLELERVFDCADLVGRVFEDRDGDGHADAREPGIAGAVLMTPRGEIVTADAHGRFSVPCAILPREGIGSNMQLKLDTRSLPPGSIVTSTNPQVIRMTRGKMSRLDFGVLPGRKATLQITDAAFGPDGQLQAKWQEGMAGMMAALRAGPTRLSLVYLDPSDRRVAKARLAAISTAITQTHERDGTAPALDIETLIRGDAR
ncbi:hypothetical protein [Profundibacterium mesophilum]|uniref:1-deoxy-D-xylulose-5-phosphate reductoisomerase n=1 Tax=Profundibacterium mesophilum KAUST100406-0324 TaxID=1037889 RepID=A0A921NZ77_9RHOB|nr:hypothetical protein [Profundibacterium mesophilum]KAF0676223.1 1-deoxy-D-xylulose-5-phosphate reductoisomerase [Profundibacterium mesophilum KAUST100406-0324]